jgi:DNA processing protein
MHDDELLYNIALTKVEHVGAITAKTLISYCGSAKDVFKEKKSKLLRIPLAGRMVVNAIHKDDPLQKAEKELQFILKNNIGVLFYTDTDYPDRLKVYSDSPVLLYYKGNVTLNYKRVISIVGTRRITEYGQNLVTQLIEGVGAYDVLVVSGLAYGVDSLTHKLCVERKIPTIGVLGHGLDRIYPAENKKLSLQMTECGGLLSEFGMNTKPDRENFPMRNRIVAGMADAVVVIETRQNGGSMITAELANSYNKDVFTFPGRTTDEFSAGCNYLIKTHKAHLIENAEDLMLNMRWDSNSTVVKPVQQKLLFDLTEDEKQIISILEKEHEIQIDELTDHLNFSPGLLASLLLHLEFTGLIRSLPGKRYSLVQ